jgi:hypothetical protein
MLQALAILACLAFIYVGFRAIWHDYQPTGHCRECGAPTEGLDCAECWGEKR